MCMKAEHDFMIAHPQVTVVADFRYIDDLLLFLTHPCEEIKSMYPPPLELEEETTLQGDKHLIHFLETLTTIQVNSGKFTIIHASKSWMNLKKGKAPIKSVTHFDTHTPYHQKFGYVVGTLVRVLRNSVGSTQLSEATSRELAAMYDHGMPAKLADAALCRLQHIMEKTMLKE